MQKKKNILLLAAILVVCVIIGTVFLTSHLNKEQNDQKMVSIPEMGKVKGKANAPALLEVFSDFNCAHCAANASKFEKEALIPYLAAGKLRLQYRHFLVGGIQSYVAALAADCAGKQDKFWPYHDLLYDNFDPQRHLEYTPADVERFRDELISWAAQLGMDITAFNDCLYDEKTKEAVHVDHSRGEQLQVKITPTYVLNGRKLEGELDDIIAIIKKEVGR